MRTPRRGISISHFRPLPLIAALGAALSPAPAMSAVPLTITVNDASDASNFNYGGPTPSTTLRGALDFLNARDVAGALVNCTGLGDTITFSGPFVISVSTSLPDIECSNVSIVGNQTQIVAGVVDMSGDGLNALAPGLSAQGLDIFGFSYGAALDNVHSATANKLHGNSRGILTSSPGATISGNTLYANTSRNIEVQGADAIIDHNTIGIDSQGNPSSNTPSAEGIRLSNSKSDVHHNTVASGGSGIRLVSDRGSEIHSNFIGTDSNGTSLLSYGGFTSGNGTGISLTSAAGTYIHDNVISGNSFAMDVSGSNLTIDHNFIGTDVTGANFLGNDQGVDVTCASNMKVTNNVIATNVSGTSIQFNAVVGGGTAATASTISGNKIGLDGTGVIPLGNNSYGILLTTEVCNTLIDVAPPPPTRSDSVHITANIVNVAPQTTQGTVGILLRGADHTLIDGNNIVRNASQAGIMLSLLDAPQASTTIAGNTLTGNRDGIDVAGDGTTITGNTITGGFNDGVRLGNASSTTLSGNVITGYGGYGIEVTAGTGNRMTGNTIFGNAGSITPPAAQKNINLGFVGAPRPPNTAGPNNGQNYPVIGTVTRDFAADTTTVAFALDALPGTYQVDLFANSAPTSVPGGNIPLGPSQNVVVTTTPASGSFSVPGVIADSFSMLATNLATGDTSEFSPVVAATLAPFATVSPASIDFGSVNVGSVSFTGTVTIASKGTADYQIFSIGDTTCSGGTICSSGDFTCSTACAPGIYHPNDSCQITANFHPSALGPALPKTIAICDNVTPFSTNPSRTVTFTGNGVTAPAAQVDIAPTSFDFGSIFVGSTSAPASFTVSNSGNAIASLGTLAASTGFLVNNTTCTTPLAAGASCTASVSFKPTSPGAASGTLSVPWSTGNTLLLIKSATTNIATAPSASAALAGTGLPPPPTPVPQVDITPASFDFGPVILGSSSASVFTVRNTGTAAATLSALGVTTGYVLGATTCGTTLAAAASCTASVSFTPASVGAIAGTLSVNWGTGLTASTSLSGTGVLPPPPPIRIAIEPASFDFGPVLLGSASSSTTFAVRNISNANAAVGSITGSPGFVVNTSTCAATLAPGAICLASVAFVPTRQGLISGVLTVSADPALSAASKAAVAGATSTALATASLSGTGTISSTVELPDAVDFGAYTSGGTPIRRTVTLTARGNAVVTINSMVVSGPFALSSACPPSLQPGESCAITLEFSAPAPGDYTGSFVVSTTANAGGRAVALTGHTVAAPIAQIRVSPLSIGFGNRLLGTSTPPQRVTITNVGNAAATLAPPLATTADFVVTTTCGNTLAPAASCTADVVLRPAGFGPRSGFLLVNSSASSSPLSVQLSGTGCRPFDASASRSGARFGCSP